MDSRSDRSKNGCLKASPVPSSSVFKTCWAHPTTREHNVSLFNGANWVPKSGSVTGGTNRWLQKVLYCSASALEVGSEERSMISRYNPLWSIFLQGGPKNDREITWGPYFQWSKISMGQWGELSLRVITPLIAGIGAHLVSVIVDAPPSRWCRSRPFTADCSARVEKLKVL